LAFKHGLEINLIVGLREVAAEDSRSTCVDLSLFSLESGGSDWGGGS
jgi:hypothetical protein